MVRCFLNEKEYFLEGTINEEENICTYYKCLNRAIPSSKCLVLRHLLNEKTLFSMPWRRRLYQINILKYLGPKIRVLNKSPHFDLTPLHDLAAHFKKIGLIVFLSIRQRVEGQSTSGVSEQGAPNHRAMILLCGHNHHVVHPIQH